MQINISGWGAVLLAVVGIVAVLMFTAPEATTDYVNGVASALSGG
ncbi:MULTISPECIES: hypothetical protein [Haloarcula]|jgi:hypothetical protein|nr:MULTISPECIES: hypothetical protein [Haloarcula]